MNGLIARRAFLSQIGLFAAAGGVGWWLHDHLLWPAPSVRFADGRSSGWLDFATPGQGVAIVETEVMGRPVRALLDSGAQSSVIDRGLADRLALPSSAFAPLIVAFGVCGAPQLGHAATLDVQLAGLRLAGLRAAMFDLASLAEATGRPFELILGQDVLKVLVADIDFPAARMALHAADGYVPPAEARALPARSSGRALLVPATIEGARLELMLDTGALALLALSDQAARAAGLLDGRPQQWAPAIGFGGFTRDRLVQAGPVEIAGRPYGEIPVQIYAPGRGAPVPKGLVGVQAFDAFRLILDMPRAALHIADSLKLPERPGNQGLLTNG